MTLKVLDTFAGAGGFSLGFHLAGAEVVGAIEIDSWAAETFKFNHPEATVLQGDITEVSDQKIIDAFGPLSPDIVLGGPPCQGFSICNKNNSDPKDPRNSLFEQFIRVGRLLRPSVMIMENVPNLIKARTETKELVIDIICSELRALGYEVDFQILEATNYGDMFVHGNNLEQKEAHQTKYRDDKSRQYLAEIRARYDQWKIANEELIGPVGAVSLRPIGRGELHMASTEAF